MPESLYNYCARCMQASLPALSNAPSQSTNLTMSDLDCSLANSSSWAGLAAPAPSPALTAAGTGAASGAMPSTPVPAVQLGGADDGGDGDTPHADVRLRALDRESRALARVA